MAKTNLTEGPIVKTLITLSIPIIFANILQTAYQLIDTFWVGRLGANAVAAVSVSFPIIFLLVSLGGGLAMSGAILVAQYKGKKDQKATDHVASQTLILVLFVSLLLAVVGYIFAPSILNLMGVETAVFRDAVSYMRISFIGIVFMFVFAVFQSLMRGVGDVKTPMLIVLGTVLLNLILDPLFIFGYGFIPAFGVSGAAVATVATEGLSSIIGVFILFFGKYGVHVRKSSLKPDFKLMKKMFRLGFPTSIEMSTRALGMTIMTFLVASFGTITLAAYGIGARMLGFIIIPALGLSMATSTLVGQNMGAGRIDRAEKTVKASLIVGFTALTFIGILFFIFAKQLSMFFMPGEVEAVAASTLFIKTMALAFGFIGIQIVLNGAFRGSGNTFISMILSIVAFWVFQFPIAYILSKHTVLATTGIWIAFPAEMIMVAFIALTWYSKGTWKKKRVTEEFKVSEKITKEALEEGLHN